MGESKLPTKPAAFAFVVLGAIAMLFAPLVTTNAQQIPEGSGQALEISPTLATLDVDPGESTTLTIQIRNVSNEDLIVSGEINDFVASDDGGSPRIIFDEEEAEATEENPYSFKDWAELPSQMLLEPGDIETLEVTINVPTDASPGGHYGIVRFSGTPPELEDTGVSLSTSVGTLILATVSGDFEESIELVEFGVTKDGESRAVFESTPLQLMQRIRNTGNIHVQPIGQIAIKDMFGRNVASPNVNLARRNILPDSARTFEQDIDSSLIGDKRLFGRYTAELKLEYGQDKTVTDTLTFWVIPFKLIGAIILILIIIFLCLRFFLKRYKQRVLRQAQSQRR